MILKLEGWPNLPRRESRLESKPLPGLIPKCQCLIFIPEDAIMEKILIEKNGIRYLQIQSRKLPEIFEEDEENAK